MIDPRLRPLLRRRPSPVGKRKKKERGEHRGEFQANTYTSAIKNKKKVIDPRLRPLLRHRPSPVGEKKTKSAAGIAANFKPTPKQARYKKKV